MSRPIVPDRYQTPDHMMPEVAPLEDLYAMREYIENDYTRQFHWASKLLKINDFIQLRTHRCPHCKTSWPTLPQWTYAAGRNGDWLVLHTCPGTFDIPTELNPWKLEPIE